VLEDKDRGDCFFLIASHEGIIQMHFGNGRSLLIRGGPPVWRVIAASGDAVLAPGAEGQMSSLMRLDLCPGRVAGPAGGRRRPGLLCLVVVDRLFVVGGGWRRQGVSAVREWFLIHTLGRRCGT